MSSSASIQGLPPVHQGGHERFRVKIPTSGVRFNDWSTTTKFLCVSTIVSILGISLSYFRYNRRRNYITDKDMKKLNIPASLQRNLSSIPAKLARQNTVLITTKDENNEKLLENLSIQIQESKKKHLELDTRNNLGHFTRVIAICVDSSISSLNAVQWAQNNILRTNDIVVLINIWETQNNFLSNIDQISRLSRTDSTEVEYEHGIELLKKLYEDYLSDDRIEALPCILRKEENKKYEKNLEIAATLLNAIKQINPDLVIMGSRGLGIYGDKIKRDVNKMLSFEFGTVSNYVSQQATCPCTIIPYVAEVNKRQTSENMDSNGVSSILDGEVVLQPQKIELQQSYDNFPSDNQD